MREKDTELEKTRREVDSLRAAEIRALKAKKEEAKELEEGREKEEGMKKEGEEGKSDGLEGDEEFRFEHSSYNIFYLCVPYFLIV